MQQEKQAYTVPELAERWACDRATIVRMIQAASITAINIGSSPRRASWRIMADEVQRFEKSRANQIPPRRRQNTATTTSGTGTWY